MRQLHTLADAIAVGLTIVAVCRNLECRRRSKIDIVQLGYRIGQGQPLLPEKGKRHFSEKMRCSDCGHVGAAIWPEEVKGPEPMMAGLSYSVNEWYGGNPTPMQAVARVSNVIVAHATYEASIGEYPNRRITLQQGAYVLRDSRLKMIRGGRA